MISLHIVFYLMILFFALIGYLRGWQREVIALTGLVASIAFLSTFGYSIVQGIPSADPTLSLDPTQALKQQFYIQAIIHGTIAFFSYQVVTRLADQVTGGRIGERVRSNLEKRIIGALIGALNGYLIVGGLWGFLEYRLTADGYQRLEPFAPYAFHPAVTRPAADSAAIVVAERFLPLTESIDPTLWLIFFFVAFFVVIVALI